MKNKIIVILMVLSAITLISSPAFSDNTNSATALSLNSSMQNASDCLQESTQIMNDMSASGFSINRIKDAINKAQQIYNAQIILLNKNVNHDFTTVIEDCKKINEIKILAYNSRDGLDAFNKFYEESKVEGMNTSSVDVLVARINSEIKSERYENVQPLIEQAYTEVTNIKSSHTTLNIFYKTTTRGIKDFFIENLNALIAIIAVILVFLIIYQKAITRILIKRKIKRLEMRKNTIKELIMKTQKQYFEGGGVSEATYNIRTKKFAELIRDIDRQIPLLNEKLLKVSNSRMYGNLNLDEKNSSNTLPKSKKIKSQKSRGKKSR